jgi:hypothetical protein
VDHSPREIRKLEAPNALPYENVIFFSTSNAAQIHAGTHLHVQIGSNGPHMDSSAERVDVPLISSGNTCQCDALDNDTADILIRHSLLKAVVIVLPSRRYTCLHRQPPVLLRAFSWYAGIRASSRGRSPPGTSKAGNAAATGRGYLALF